MEMSLRLVVVATIALLASTILIFLFTGQVSDFGGFLDSQTNQSQCDLLVERGKLTEALKKGCDQEGAKSACKSLDKTECDGTTTCIWEKPDDKSGDACEGDCGSCTAPDN